MSDKLYTSRTLARRALKRTQAMLLGNAESDVSDSDSEDEQNDEIEQIVLAASPSREIEATEQEVATVDDINSANSCDLSDLATNILSDTEIFPDIENCARSLWWEVSLFWKRKK